MTMTATTKNAPSLSGDSAEGNDRNPAKGTIMKDATSVPQTPDSRWTRVHVETTGVLADEVGVLVVIDNRDDVIHVPASEIPALIDDLMSAAGRASDLAARNRIWAKYAHLFRQEANQ